MLFPPEEFRDYVQVDPDKGLTLRDDAPEDIQEAFDRWLQEVQDFTSAGFQL